MTDSRESQFQQDIIDQMVAAGWLTGPASGYERSYALYTEDLLAFMQARKPSETISYYAFTATPSHCASTSRTRATRRCTHW